MPARRPGTVLLIVVVIVMLLSLAAYKYMLTMEIEHMAAAINGDRLQAQQSAQSARDLFVLMMKKPRAERDALGGLEDNPAFFAGNTEALEGTLQTSSVSDLVQTPPFGLVAYGLQPDPLLAPSLTNTANALPSQNAQRTSQSSTNISATGDAALFPPTRYGAINESQKLHLLKVLQFELAEPGAGVAALMSLPGMDEATAEAILDWIDSDDDPRASGAESEFYSTLTRPLAPRNGLPPDIDELLFVKGVTSLRLFGIQTELPGVTPSNGAFPQTGAFSANISTNMAQPNSVVPGNNGFGPNSEPPRPWLDYLTVYSAERNESYTGGRRIFLNSKDLPQLHADLSEAMSKEWADFVILYRQFGPSDNDSDTASSSQNSNPDETTINFDLPAKVLIESSLDLIGASVIIPPADGEEAEEEQDETIVESPIGPDPSSLNTELLDLLDQVTTSEARKLVGRVNVNLAPATVLGALPGLSEDTVESIVSAREGAADEASARSHPTWLLVEGLVDLETMRTILPHVTCGGDVYKAEIWGRSGQEKRSPMVHFETVLDATGKSVHAVYYRELDARRDQIKVLTTEEFASLGIQTPTLDSQTGGSSQF